MHQMRRTQSLLFALVAVFALSACAPEADRSDEPSGPVAAAIDPTVEITVADDLAFIGPSEVPSGWTSLRLVNNNPQPHFMTLARLPEGVTFEEYNDRVAVPFIEEHAAYKAGEKDRDTFLGDLGGRLPEWFGTVVFSGGVGLTSPGHSSRTWVHLEPGNYVMECYVLSPDEGTFHNGLGMLRPLIVSSENSGLEPPGADVGIDLSNYAITSSATPSRGRRIVAVRTLEAAEGLIPHDLHLARLTDDGSLASGVAWMDWIDAMTPPAPVEFLGGVEGVAPGETTYLEVDLQPGRYAWISEGYGASHGMLEEFVVE